VSPGELVHELAQTARHGRISHGAVPVGDVRCRVRADHCVEQLDLLGEHGSGFGFVETRGVSES
jgi:hypothetical protein